MIKFLLKVILFFILAIFVIYLFETGTIKKGLDYIFKKTNVEKIIDKGEKKIKEEIKKKVEEKLPEKKEVEKYEEEERKRIEEIIKKGSP